MQVVRQRAQVGPATRHLHVVAPTPDLQHAEAVVASYLEAVSRSRRGGEAASPALEASFIEVAGCYSHSHGLTRLAWRARAVDDQILRRAGIE